MNDRPKPWQVELSKPNRLLDKFFKIDEYKVSHERFDGKMSEEQTLLVFERGDAVAALLYDPERRKIIAVNQFRLPARLRGRGTGWLTEAVAGMIRVSKTDGRPEETPLQCLSREVREETGYQLTHATPVATFFSSPGGTTELIHLFYAEVRQTEQVAKGGGVREDGEDIDVVEYDIDEFFRMLTAGEFEDPKLIISGQWLMARRATFLAEINPKKSRTFRYTFNAEKGGQGRIIGIKTGNIKAVEGVDVWVNSENTDMMMDRFFGRSISATIRSLGAKKYKSGAIERDTIGEALAEELNKGEKRNFVAPGTVLETTSGELKDSHKVQKIFHVAAVAGHIGEGLSTNEQTLKESIDNVLEAISARGYKSALIPIFGTGQGGSRVQDVAPLLVDRAIAFFKETPNSKLREIYFLAYSEGDFEVLTAAMERSEALAKPPRRS